MRLRTKFLDEIHVDKKDFISFEEGLPGFPAEKCFVILSTGDKYPFYLLQSAEVPELCFIIISPFEYFKDYDIEIPDHQLEQLGIDFPVSMQIWSILNIMDSLGKATVNLQAPIVVNTARGLARQIILNDPRYSIRHPLTKRQCQENSSREQGD